jgi:hypothetical protein
MNKPPNPPEDLLEELFNRSFSLLDKFFLPVDFDEFQQPQQFGASQSDTSPAALKASILRNPQSQQETDHKRLLSSSRSSSSFRMLPDGSTENTKRIVKADGTVEEIRTNCDVKRFCHTIKTITRPDGTVETTEEDHRQ